MGIEPIAPQIAMLNAVNDPKHRQIVGCLSRRTGKTFISNTIAFLKAMEPGTTILIVSPNYSLTNISWNEQLRMLTELDIEIVGKNKTDREIKLQNGSMIKFGSVSQANSLVGRSYDLILFDEAALDGNGRDCYNIQLRPTLDKPNSKVIFISTPRAGNYFKDFYERGFSSEFPTWVSVHSTWKDNPRMTEEDTAEARRGMSRAEFEQEYMASFVTMEGQIYEDFDPEMHVGDYSGIDFNTPRYETIMGIDPGYKDATGGLVLKYDYDEEIFYVVWDYQEAGRTTEKHAESFNNAINQWDVDFVVVDSAAAQFRQDLALMYDISSASAKKSVLDGIGYCQVLVEQGRIRVDERCEHVIAMLLNYRWDPNEALLKPKPLHDEYSHVADAFRYALYSFVL